MPYGGTTRRSVAIRTAIHDVNQRGPRRTLARLANACAARQGPIRSPVARGLARLSFQKTNSLDPVLLHDACRLRFPALGGGATF